ncbi:autotransporter-associated beta strand repeat-containing protein, partial [Neisseriaceae bacterium TC5R-5]|nr:autotransporter-associated beta strand repeat-containing protein [Neisseriaceae bacterium TC5R-5]
LLSAISGEGGFTKTGAGTLTLSGTNSYTGATNINNGTLQLSSINELQSSSAMGIADGATLNTGGVNQQLNSLSGAGTVQMGTTTLTANNNINKDSTFSGTINGLGGTLVKTGVGSLKLSNKGSQLGNVTVSNGDLNLAHSGALIVSGNYITQNGASTTLSAEPGQLRVNGTFTQADGSTLNATIGATPDISAQNIVLGGVLNINGFNEGKQPVKASEAIGRDYVLMTSNNVITGTFTNNVNDTIDYLQLTPGLARGDQD